MLVESSSKPEAGDSDCVHSAERACPWFVDVDGWEERRHGALAVEGDLVGPGRAPTGSVPNLGCHLPLSPSRLHDLEIELDVDVDVQVVGRRT